MSERGWGCVSEPVNKPGHTPVARNEEFIIRRLEANPRKPWKVANLEIPRLEMQHFEMVVTAEDPSPSTLAILLELFLRRYFTLDACARFF